MPLAGEAIPTHLTIFPDGHKERWLRIFADRPLVTAQWQGRRGMLVERFGPVELRFRLDVQNGALTYRQTGTALRLGLFPIPLPSWLAPQVVAREEPAGKPNRVRVAVQVLLPLVGELISYDGSMTLEQAS